MIKDLKNNIKREKELIKRISYLKSQLSQLSRFYKEKNRVNMVKKSLNSHASQLKMINNSIPLIVENISVYKKLGKKKKQLEKLKLEGKGFVLNKKDKKKFRKKLNISEETLKRLRHDEKETEKREFMEIEKAGIYAKISNRVFLNFSTSLIKKDYFKKLNLYLRKANLPYLLTTYLSMIFFSSLLSVILAFVFLAFVLIFPQIIPYSIIFGFSSIVIFPAIVFSFLYLYPWLESKNVGSNIDQELPFLTIHMSAIAGSGIEPSQIFKIISSGKEYPKTSHEMKKIINQVNVYGYDLVTALKNTARETSSEKLSELLNGMATMISGGGSLNKFLDKKAESLLFEYRLEREKYNKSAETFMDIYIGVVIAAPMIMTLLFVLMSISKISLGLSIDILTLLMVSIVALINLAFLLFLHFEQPSY